MELLLKWVGGKKKYSNFIYDVIIQNNIKFNNFYEPFFGSGAITFFLMEKKLGKKFIVNDINERLIYFYENVRDNCKKLIEEIEKIRLNNKGKLNYYKLREEYNSLIDKKSKKSLKNSAIFYFINRTCFNGIYRVNKSGRFNTPCGSNVDNFNFNKERFIEFSKKLEKCKIYCNDWKKIIDKATKGDLIYLDPPYYTGTSSSFIGYTEQKFDNSKYEEMIEIIYNKTKEGVDIILSNSNSDELRALIEKKFKEYKFCSYPSNRTINPKVNKERKKDFIESIYYFKGDNNG